MSEDSGETWTGVRRDDANGVIELRLANGFEALIVPRRDAPVVSVQTWYRVGSREEQKGKTGLAHFLEHLMFKGTETLRKGDIDLVTLRNGGQNNADTTVDRTRYYFTLASDRWESALEIEADRMRGSAFDEHEFRAERGPVIEELRRDRDDPWWTLHETLEATAFQVHPYRNPVIGWPEEILSVPREDVLAFYNAWYRPGSCTLVVAGDVDVDAAVQRIEELFGPIEAAPRPQPLIAAEPPQEGERRFELELDVNLPRMIAAFHTVRVRDPEDAVLDVLQVLLSHGKSSVLYDRLVRRDRLASVVYASNDTRRDPGLFLLMLELQEDADPADAESAVWDEIHTIARDGPKAEHLERARAILRAGHVFSRATATGLAEALGTHHVLGGDWRLLPRHAERLETITAEDVQEVVRRFLIRRNRTVGWAVPRPDGAPPRPPIPDAGLHELDEEPPADERPEPAIVTRVPTGRLRVDLPARRVELENGLRLLVIPRRGLPEVSVRAFVSASRLREAHPGVAALTGACLDEGAGTRDGPEISAVFADVGARFGAGSGGFSLRCLTRDLRDCLSVAVDTLRRPRFPSDALDRKRGELISHLRSEDDDPSVIAALRLRAEIYGDHPLGRRDKGSVAELEAVTEDHLRAHHRALFVPRNTIVAVVGDVDTDAAVDMVREQFGDWDDRKPLFPSLTDPELGGARNVHVEEDRDQLHLYLGHLGIRRADPDFYALLVADHVLGTGPGFTDRMSRVIRDEQGLAYTTWARITRSADLEPGLFSAYVGTSPDMRERAEAAMREQIGTFVSGAAPATHEEIEDARRYLLGSYVFGFETNSGTAEQIVQLERHGLGCDYPDRFVERVEAVTAEEIQAAVARHIHPDRLVCVSVGRAAS